MNETDHPIPHKRIAGHLILQFLALFIALGAANYYAFNHPKRWDVSRDSKADLSNQTRNFLKRLDEDVKIYLLFQPGNLLLQDTANLLKEYQYHARRKLNVIRVNPSADYEKALELKKLYEFSLQEDVLIVVVGDRHKLIRASALAEFDLSQLERGGEPRLSTFLGERIVTSALIELVESEQPIVYFTYGHLEPEPTPDGELSLLVGITIRQNVEIRPLLLSESGRVPEDASAVVLPGPQVDLPQDHITALTSYWAQGGRLLVALWNGTSSPRLDSFLASRGISPSNDQVIAVTRDTLSISKVRDVATSPTPNHQITRRYKDTDVVLRGRTQSLILANPPPAGIKLAPLLEAQEGYWGESNVVGLDTARIPRFDPAVDVPPPVVVAAAAEQQAPEDERISTSAGKLVVLGNAFCLYNPGVTPGVIDFYSSTLNWLLDRKDLIGIPAKPAGHFPPNLSAAELSAIQAWILFAMPGLAALMGLVAWAMRRS